MPQRKGHDKTECANMLGVMPSSGGGWLKVSSEIWQLLIDGLILLAETEFENTRCEGCDGVEASTE